MIKDNKIFLGPREVIFLFKRDPGMKNWIKRDSRTILFCAMNSQLFDGFENVLFSNSSG